MVIPLIIRNWLELDMSNVLLLDRKSYIRRHLSVSTDLSYVWLFLFRGLHTSIYGDNI